jgi:hypothetical protein
LFSRKLKSTKSEGRNALGKSNVRAAANKTSTSGRSQAGTSSRRSGLGAQWPIVQSKSDLVLVQPIMDYFENDPAIAIAGLTDDGLQAHVSAWVGGSSEWIYEFVNNGTHALFEVIIPRGADGITYGPITIEVDSGNDPGGGFVYTQRLSMTLEDDGTSVLRVAFAYVAGDANGRPTFSSIITSATVSVRVRVSGIPSTAQAPVIRGYSKLNKVYNTWSK